jgi:hypothetical protein
MPKLKYLVSGHHEGISEHLGRVTVAAALRKARQLVQEGYIDVRICTPRGQVLLSDDFNHLEKPKEADTAKGRQQGNREAKKPRKKRSRSSPQHQARKRRPGSRASCRGGRNSYG